MEDAWVFSRILRPLLFPFFWVNSSSSFFSSFAQYKHTKELPFFFFLLFFPPCFPFSPFSFGVLQLSQGLILAEASLTQMRGSVSRANRFLFSFDSASFFSLSFFSLYFSLIAFPFLYVMSIKQQQSKERNDNDDDNKEVKMK